MFDTQSILNVAGSNSSTLHLNDWENQECMPACTAHWHAAVHCDAWEADD